MPDNDFTYEGYDTIDEVTFSQDLSVGSLNFTTSLAKDFKINYVSLRLSGVANQDLVIKIDALAGVNYDCKLLDEKLNGDLVFVPEYRFAMKAGNEINVTLTNTGTPAVTVYGVVSISRV